MSLDTEAEKVAIQPKKAKTLVNEIATRLGESEAKPRKQISLMLEHCGLEFVESLIEEALQIEASGGLLIDNGERRRTLGGVFLFLARQRVPDPIREEIFFVWRHAARQRAEYESQFPPFDWEERAAVIQSLLANKGKVTDVKITLSGRPGTIERRQNLVITTLENQLTDLPTLPVGIPELPKTPQQFVVYIAAKQWEKVEKAVAQPDDELVVDGICIFDPQINALAVYTTFATTKKNQRKDRKQAEGSNNKKPDAAPGRRSDNLRLPAVESASMPHFDIPPGVPEAVAQELIKLHTAASTFRHKISTVEAKPPDQQIGLEMTRKLLKDTERKIDALEKQYTRA